jgi:hypothetical protein
MRRYTARLSNGSELTILAEDVNVVKGLFRRVCYYEFLAKRSIFEDDWDVIVAILPFNSVESLISEEVV